MFGALYFDHEFFGGSRNMGSHTQMIMDFMDFMESSVFFGPKMDLPKNKAHNKKKQSRNYRYHVQTGE
jgi:hypothetical protein